MYLIMLNLYPFLLPFNLSDYLSELYPDFGLLKVQAYITKNYLPVSHVPFFKEVHTTSCKQDNSPYSFSSICPIPGSCPCQQ